METWIGLLGVLVGAGIAGFFGLRIEDRRATAQLVANREARETDRLLALELIQRESVLSVQEALIAWSAAEIRYFYLAIKAAEAGSGETDEVRELSRIEHAARLKMYMFRDRITDDGTRAIVQSILSKGWKLANECKPTAPVADVPGLRIKFRQFMKDCQATTETLGDSVRRLLIDQSMPTRQIG